MDYFAKLVDGFKPLTIFATFSITGIWPGSKYDYAAILMTGVTASFDKLVFLCYI